MQTQYNVLLCCHFNQYPVCILNMFKKLANNITPVSIEHSIWELIEHQNDTEHRNGLRN